jgi:hypothetical protein
MTNDKIRPDLTVQGHDEGMSNDQCQKGEESNVQRDSRGVKPPRAESGVKPPHSKGSRTRTILS